MSRRKKHQCDYYGGTYWQTLAYNQNLFFAIQNRILELALARFTWLNLPETCNERFLEYTLLTQGMATIAFPRSKKGIFFSTQAVTNGAPNVYNNPSHWRSVGNNGWNFNVNHKNGVLVYDNLTRYPLINELNIYAREIVDTIRTAQLNRKNQKAPMILQVGQEQKQDAINLYKQIDGGEPAIIVDKDFSTIETKAIDLQVPYIGKELHEELLNWWQQVYTVLGIASLPFKSERQIQDEVTSMNEPTELMTVNPLKCRREACKVLNERFGQYLSAPIDVVWSRDFVSDNYNLEHDLKQQLELDAGGDASV